MNIIKKMMLALCTMALVVHNSYAFFDTKEKNQSVFIKIFTDENLNKDIFDKASPLKIIFLQLSSKAEFDQYQVLDLEQNNKAILGESLLEEYSLMVSPDQIAEVTLDIGEKSEYLGIIFVFRDESLNWKYVFEKQKVSWLKKKKNYLNFEIRDNEFYQLDLKESAKLTLDKQLKKLKKEGLDVSELSDKELKKLASKIEKSSYPKQKTDLSKGVYKKY